MVIFHGLTLYYHVIYLSLHIPSQLLFEHLGNHSLISGPHILQIEWHDLVMKITSRGNEKGFLLVFGGQSYPMVPLKHIKKAQPRVPKSFINKLINLG